MPLTACDWELAPPQPLSARANIMHLALALFDSHDRSCLVSW